MMQFFIENRLLEGMRCHSHTSGSSSCRRTLQHWEAGCHSPCAHLQLARSPSSLWAPCQEQSHEDLVVQRSAREQSAFLQFPPRLHRESLRFPRHPRALKVCTPEASSVLSGESVPDPG